MLSDTSPPAPPSRTRLWWAKASRVALGLVLGAWALFLLLLAALHFWIVPRITEWRGDLERWASHAVGQPVHIASLRALPGPGPSWLPTPPALVLGDVRLLDAQGRVAVRLPSVQVSLSLASLWRLGFERLLIEAPVLQVRRLADGRILVAGQDIDTPGSNTNPRALEWLLEQREWQIRGGTVRWSDELRQAPPLALTGVQMTLRRRGSQHDWQIDAVPPPEWGRPFALSATLRDPLLPWQQADTPLWLRWQGQIVAEFPAVDIQHLRQHVDAAQWGMDWRAGVGSLVLQTELRAGLPVAVQARLGLRDVDMRLGKGLEPLRLRSVQGPLRLERQAQRWRVQSDGLTLQVDRETPWSGGRWDWGLQWDANGALAEVSLDAADIDLARLSALAERLPLDGWALQTLQRLRPAGVVQRVQGTWSAPPEAQAPWWHGRYQIDGALQGLALAGEARSAQSAPSAGPGRPGISGAQLRFSADQQGGQAEVLVRDGVLDLPGVFEERRLPLQRLQTQVRWRWQGERLDVWLDGLNAANADAEAQGQVHWHTTDGASGAARFPGVLDLSATLSRGDATRIHRYLPLSVSPEVRRYVREAVRAGRVPRVDFRVRGAVYDMPLTDGAADGDFRIRADLSDLTFDYVPPFLGAAAAQRWPALTQLQGELLLDRGRFVVSGIQAGLDGLPGLLAERGEVHILGLGGNDWPKLSVRTAVSGPAAAMLNYVRRAPIDTWLGGALSQARSGGNARLDLALLLPFENPAATEVQGTLQLDGNDLRLSPEAPALLGARGELQFTQNSFVVRQARAQLYGGEVRFDGGWAAGAAGPVFKGEGRASADGLRAQAPAVLARLLGGASGAAAYRAQLGVVRGHLALDLQSDLQGLALPLPAPLGKRADEAVPLHWQRTLSGPDALGDSLRLDWGQGSNALRVRYDRSLAEAQPRVLRGAVALGLDSNALPEPASGVQAHLRLPRLVLADWQRLLTEGAGLDLRTVADTDAPWQAYVPTQMALHTDVLEFDGRRFGRVVIGAARQGRQWIANIDAPEASGYVELALAPSGALQQARARLARLHLPNSSASEAERIAGSSTELPALDLVVEDFRLGTRELGRLEVSAEPRGSGTSREWRLTTLLLQTPEARLRASGNWALPLALGPGQSTQRRTQLGVQLDIDDSGALLARFGHPGTVRGAKGRIEGQIGWHGTPFQPDWHTATGQLRVDVERGQFLKVDPGVAKLLGVLNLQALPRRLALDFRDVFSEGFAFDFVRGDARIERGVVATNNLQMKGVNAAVLMEGQAHITTETQDIRVVVVPEINAGTASLIATAINPAVGLGTFFAQFLLNQPLQSAATQTFHVTGTWTDPKIDKLARPDTAAVPPDSPR